MSYIKHFIKSDRFYFCDRNNFFYLKIEKFQKDGYNPIIFDVKNSKMSCLDISLLRPIADESEMEQLFSNHRDSFIELNGRWYVVTAPFYPNGLTLYGKSVQLFDISMPVSNYYESSLISVDLLQKILLDYHKKPTKDHAKNI